MTPILEKILSEVEGLTPDELLTLQIKITLQLSIKTEGTVIDKTSLNSTRAGWRIVKLADFDPTVFRLNADDRTHNLKVWAETQELVAEIAKQNSDLQVNAVDLVKESRDRF